MIDPLRGPADFVARIIELGLTGVNGLARIGSDVLLAALLAGLGRASQDEFVDESPGDGEGSPSAEDDDLASAELISRGLLMGEGRYTRREAAERAGASFEEAQRLWRALGFPEVGDDERVFTSADVAALADSTALIADGIVDQDALVELARPLGNLMSRLAAAQTSFISEVLGSQIAAGLTVDDPQLPELLAAHALTTTRELLPVLELTTLHAWRRHLAAELGRALSPSAYGPGVEAERRPAAVGFVDITGYTRISRNLDLAELAALLNSFETAVLDVVVRHDGRVIKNLGDEILFVVEDPLSAAEVALELLDVFAADASLPPIHGGLAYGPVLYRGGDVYGPVVNVAARLCSIARKGTIRVDQDMADALDGADQFALSGRTPRHVRGYLQLPSYRLRRAKTEKEEP